MNLINSLKEGSVFSTLLSSPVFILTPQYLRVIILLGQCALNLGGGCCVLAQLCPALCDRLDCSTPDSPALHHLPELAQIQERRQSISGLVDIHAAFFASLLSLVEECRQRLVCVCCGNGQSVVMVFGWWLRGSGLPL